MKHVAIIGDGGWGTALALVLHNNGHAVRVWGPFADYIAEIQRRHRNEKFLPGIELPTDIRWTADKAEAVAGADVVILAVPSRFFRSVLESFTGFSPPPLGPQRDQGPGRENRNADDGSGRRVVEARSVAALSGPSLAAEVARGIPTAVTIACADHCQGEIAPGPAHESLFPRLHVR